MTKFKAGDKVRLVAKYAVGDNEAFDLGALKLGSIYTIESVWNGAIYPYGLIVTAAGLWKVSEDMIELVQKEMPEMNANTNTIQSLEAQIAELQQKLEEAKKAEEEKNPWKLAPVTAKGFFCDTVSNEIGKNCAPFNGEDLTTFATEKAAEGFLNVWNVMVLLRQQKGAGKRNEDGYGWMFDMDTGECIRYSTVDCFALFPAFQTEALAQAAVEAIGKDRIIAAYNFLDSGE